MSPQVFHRAHLYNKHDEAVSKAESTLSESAMLVDVLFTTALTDTDSLRLSFCL